METPLDLTSVLSRAVLDLEVLEGLQRLQERRNSQLLARLCKIFDQQSQVRVDQLRGACQEGDPAAAAEAAHSLKGSCRSLGLERLAELCNGIEVAARNGDTSWCDDWLPALDEQAQISRRQLAEFLAS